MTVSFSTAIRNAMLNALRDQIDGGSGAGKLRIYNGTKPAAGAAITTEVLLAELTLSDPCAGAAASGVLTFSPITQDSSANASGNASWFRIVDSADTYCIDGAITATGGGGDLTLATVAVVATQPVQVSALTITAGQP